MDINKTFQLALKHYQAGNFQQAQSICREILNVQPDNADALHLLGIIYYQLNDYDSAIQYTQKALQFSPADADAYYNLGNAREAKGQLDEAVTCYQKALQLDPNFAEAYNNLGHCFYGKGQLDEAINCYQKALQINPNYPEAHNNLGYALHDKGQLDESIFRYKKAIELNPNNPGLCNKLGVVLGEKGQFDEAITYFQKALQLDPDDATAYYNIGKAYTEKGHVDEAINSYLKSLKLNPDNPIAYNNLGNAFQEKGQIGEAITFCQKAIDISPNFALAHWNLSLALLIYGNYKRGWKEYEWRLKVEEHEHRNFSQPLWDGSDIKGLTILLYAEQGIGDTIQFIRYASLVAQRSVKVIVECQKELVQTLQNVEGVDKIIARGEQLPIFDVHCPILSLPLVFDTTLENIPTKIPYIFIAPMLVKKWKDRIKCYNSKLKIGLAWAGNPKNRRDSTRSCNLELFSPFAKLDYITFYSLQKGEAAKQAKNPPKGMNLIDYTEDIRDFSDTAAFIENLDLIISVDTAVAHLAGALGKPVWTLLPFAPDWRWLLNRDDSPWYPTMRLFRQPSPGDWKSVINQVLKELQKKIS